MILAPLWSLHIPLYSHVKTSISLMVRDPYQKVCVYLRNERTWTETTRAKTARDLVSCSSCSSSGRTISDHRLVSMIKYGGFLKWGCPNSWLVYNGKSMKIPSINGWWLGVALFQETSICILWALKRCFFPGLRRVFVASGTTLAKILRAGSNARDPSWGVLQLCKSNVNILERYILGGSSHGS